VAGERSKSNSRVRSSTFEPERDLRTEADLWRHRSLSIRARFGRVCSFVPAVRNTVSGAHEADEGRTPARHTRGRTREPFSHARAAPKFRARGNRDRRHAALRNTCTLIMRQTVFFFFFLSFRSFSLLADLHGRSHGAAAGWQSAWQFATRGANKYDGATRAPRVRTYTIVMHVCGNVRATLCRYRAFCAYVCVCVMRMRVCVRSGAREHGSHGRKNNTEKRREHSRGCTDRGGRATGVIWRQTSVPSLSSAALRHCLPAPLRRHCSPHYSRRPYPATRWYALAKAFLRVSLRRGYARVRMCKSSRRDIGQRYSRTFSIGTFFSSE